MTKKCMLLLREAHFEVKMYKAHQVRTTFGRSDVVSRGRVKGLCTLSATSHYANYTTLLLIALNYTINHTNDTILQYLTLHYTAVQQQQ